MWNLLSATGGSIGLAFLLLTGCASKPTNAELMRRHASELQAQTDLKNQLAKDLDRGSKLVTSGAKRVKDGEKRVKSAERDLKRGQDDIKRGQREIAKGKRLIDESEKKFKENFPELKFEHWGKVA